MNTNHVISDEVLEQVETALLKGEHYMVYNGSLYFVDVNDVNFFKDKEAAQEFVENNISDHDSFTTIRIDSIPDVLKQVSYSDSLHEDRAIYQANKIEVMAKTEPIEKQLAQLGFPEDWEAAIVHDFYKAANNCLLKYKMQYGSDTMKYYVQIRGSEKSPVITSYEAILVKPIEIPERTIDGINTTDLENRMRKIDWENEPCEILWTQLRIRDDFKEYYPIEAIVSDIFQLERANDEGKDLSERLQYKYWSEGESEELVLNLYSIQDRFETWKEFHIGKELDFTAKETYLLLTNQPVYKAAQWHCLNPLKKDERNCSVLEKISVEQANGILSSLKNTTMNTENFDYLKDQVKYLGFGEGLQSQLERKMKEGMPDFQLTASHEFGKDKMEAVLYFKKSEKQDSDRYFFNKYDATLRNEDKKLSQTFWINNKGQSITFKESCNLLNARSVFKELVPKEGAPYKAWVKLDFANKDENDNAKLKPYNSNYGFDVVEAVNRIPLKELSFPDQTQTLIASLEKGNRADATLMKDGKEQKVSIEANPQFKTLNLYDKEGKKLFMPAAKQEVKYGQAPVDQKKTERNELLTKKTQTNGLIEKKTTKKTKGQALA